MFVADGIGYKVDVTEPIMHASEEVLKGITRYHKREK